MAVPSNPEPQLKHGMLLALASFVASTEEKKKNAELQFANRVRRRGRAADTVRTISDLFGGERRIMDVSGRNTRVTPSADTDRETCAHKQ